MAQKGLFQGVEGLISRGMMIFITPMNLLHSAEECLCRAEAEEKVEADRNMTLVICDEEADNLFVFTVFFLYV